MRFELIVVLSEQVPGDGRVKYELVFSTFCYCHYVRCELTHFPARNEMAPGKTKNSKSQSQQCKSVLAPSAELNLVWFGCTPKELKELMETRGPEAVARIQNKYGSVDELCRRLAVSPNEGIDFSFIILGNV